MILPQIAQINTDCFLPQINTGWFATNHTKGHEFFLPQIAQIDTEKNF